MKLRLKSLTLNNLICEWKINLKILFFIFILCMILISQRSFSQCCCGHFRLKVLDENNVQLNFRTNPDFSVMITSLSNAPDAKPETFNANDSNMSFYFDKYDSGFISYQTSCGLKEVIFHMSYMNQEMNLKLENVQMDLDYKLEGLIFKDGNFEIDLAGITKPKDSNHNILLKPDQINKF